MQPFLDQSQLYLSMLQSQCFSVKHNMTLYSPGHSSSMALLKTDCHTASVAEGT